MGNKRFENSYDPSLKMNCVRVKKHADENYRKVHELEFPTTLSMEKESRVEEWRWTFELRMVKGYTIYRN